MKRREKEGTREGATKKMNSNQLSYRHGKATKSINICDLMECSLVVIVIVDVDLLSLFAFLSLRSRGKKRNLDRKRPNDDDDHSPPHYFDCSEKKRIEWDVKANNHRESASNKGGNNHSDEDDRSIDLRPTEEWWRGWKAARHVRDQEETVREFGSHLPNWWVAKRKKYI